MKRVSFVLILVATALVKQAMAQDAAIFIKDGVTLPVTNTGNNTLVELNKADSVFAFGMAVATFPPGKRLDWHSHPGGQILLITDGAGYYQEKDKPKRIVRKGEVIKCLPGVEHWHGASADSSVSYLAANPSQKGPTIWFKKVTDAQYFGAIAPAKNSPNAKN